ncbi:MAG: hypothetical protein MZU95_13415 [Desulfomicrobium escambiense]|nr:hypothetical protein [Desulfomicrobium escambiense]
MLQHHERLNGTGYPQGLAGRRHPAGGAHRRRGRRAWRPCPRTGPTGPRSAWDKALEEISAQKGILYDPDAVDACLEPHPREAASSSPDPVFA